MTKVKVRIAVAVDRFGEWNSCGYPTSDSNEDRLMGVATDPLSEEVNCYWLEAELDIPEEKTIQAKVTPVWNPKTSTSRTELSMCTASALFAGNGDG